MSTAPKRVLRYYVEADVSDWPDEAIALLKDDVQGAILLTFDKHDLDADVAHRRVVEPPEVGRGVDLIADALDDDALGPTVIGEMQARDLNVGDAFLWCARRAQVVDWKPGSSKRPGRYFICEVEGVEGDKQLHYYDAELVTVLA